METMIDAWPVLAWVVGAVVVAGIATGAWWTFYQSWRDRRSK